ncbi:MAG TPA: O-antigen ligase family protein [Usitatibacter sp.]|nr:O-antigen ligase family protein [Usitatibacter sp.]
MEGELTSLEQRSSTWHALLLALSASGYALISVLPVLFQVDSRVVTVPYRSAFLIASWIFVWFSLVHRRRFGTGRYLYLLAAFWALFLTRMVVDTVFLDEAIGFTPYDYWTFTLGITLLPCIAFLVIPNWATMVLAAEMTIFVTVVSAAANLWVGWDEFVVSRIGRFQTETLNPIAFGYLGTTLISTSLYILMCEWPGYRERLRARPSLVALLSLGQMLVAPIVGVAVLYAAGSRGPVIGTMLCILVIAYFAQVKRVGKFARMFVLAACAAGALIMIEPVLDEGGGILLDRLESIAIADSTNLSDTERLGLWAGAWEQFIEHPFVGSGLEEKTFRFYPHNMVLESLMATGVLGGALFLGIFVAGMIAAIRSLRWHGAGWIGLIVVAQTANAIYTGSVWGSQVYWHYLIAILALNSVMSRARTSNPTQPAYQAAALLGPHSRLQ